MSNINFVLISVNINLLHYLRVKQPTRIKIAYFSSLKFLNRIKSRVILDPGTYYNTSRHQVANPYFSSLFFFPLFLVTSIHIRSQPNWDEWHVYSLLEYYWAFVRSVLPMPDP